MRKPSRPDIGTAKWEEAPLFPSEPAPWLARGLAWLLIAMFLTALVAAIVVRVPETVQSPFVLVTQEGGDPIQAPRGAVLERVLVREGQQVKRGETLFVLRVDQVREWRAETATREQTLAASREASPRMEEAHTAALRMKDGEIDQARREIAFRTEHLRIMKDLVQRATKLSTSGLISDMELASHRLSASESEKDLEVARKTLAQKLLERRALEVERARQKIAERSAAEEQRIRISSLKEPLSASSNDLLEVRAPYEGICVNVAQQSAGAVVAAGDELCQLTPTTARLRARLLLPESGLPRLQASQRIRFLFDAFPYQRYGIVPGSIAWISPAAVARRDGSDFVAIATIDRSEIRSGGKSFPLRAGMKGQARITVGRRALIEFALEPLRQIRENAGS